MISGRWVLLALYLVLMLVPGVSFLRGVGGLTGLAGSLTSIEEVAHLVVRLFALYGLPLYFAQIVTGAFSQPLSRRLEPGLRGLHVVPGLIVYAVILVHPISYLVQLSQEGAQKNDGNAALGQVDVAIDGTAVAQASTAVPLILLGVLGLALLSTGVAAGILRRRPPVANCWRTCHLANYAAFLVVLAHSLLIGEDTTNSPFVFLYPVFVAGFLLAILQRHVRVLWR